MHGAIIAATLAAIIAVSCKVADTVIATIAL